jgi:hypothetical protein
MPCSTMLSPVSAAQLFKSAHGQIASAVDSHQRALMFLLAA